MEKLSQLSLHEPLWLLLGLLPLVILAWRKSNYQLSARLKEFAEPHLWPWLITTPNQKKPSVPPWLLFIAWLLATLAISGPYLKQPHTELQQQRGMDIAVVIDISPSMKTRDVFPDRLDRVKLEMQDFIARIKGDRTALIAFSANAYEILPLTNDHDTLLSFVKALDVTLTRKRGSNITQALELAKQTLADSASGSRGIVLISDGETDDKANTEAAARRLAKDAIPLYILGVGTEAGGPVEDDIGRLIRYNDEVVISRLQRSTLMSLAALSGGAYTDLKDDNSDWQQLFSAMDKLERKNVYQVPAAQQGYALFPWFLGASIILFVLAGTRRVDIIAVVLLIPFIFSQDVHAASWQESQAYDAFTNKDYSKASIAYEHIQTFNGQMGAGAAAYRLGNWQQAIEDFSLAAQLATNDTERAKADYNRGNTLARMGDYDQASKAYQAALALQKNYPHAALNLTLVNKERLQSGMKNPGQLKITPNAQDALSDKNAKQTDKSIANTDEPQGNTSNGTTASSSAINPGHKEVINQSIAQWNLGKAKTDEALAAALWQTRALDDTPAALLRSRFIQMDARNPDIAEEKPW